MIITSQTLQVGGVVSFYMSAALVMVFVNKAVLNNSPDMPLFFLMVQLLIAVALLHASAFMSKRIEIPQWDVQTAKKLVPVVLVNIVGLVFNTLCLRDVEASFFQIARGLVLPLTVVVSSVHTHTSPSKKVVLATAVVTIGFLIGVAPSASVPVTAAPSLLSLFYGVLSSLFIALHAVLIKISLPYCNNSTIQLAWWTNVGSAIFLLPALVFHQEHSIMYSKLTSENWSASVFIWGSLVTGVFGFLLCIAGLLSIKVTSPITHMFSSAARSVLQTLLGVWIFNDLLNVNRASSILVILGGTMLYTWIKSNETAPAPPRPPIDLESMGGDKTTSEEEALVWEVPEKYAEGKD
ncbi:hypothetical protein BD779DRAFT_1666773 [Infundibulicybe gibba]|nr:hypothetical protein BD779DRAFT_1666773 [Infundibulicybe gibba]